MAPRPANASVESIAAREPASASSIPSFPLQSVRVAAAFEQCWQKAAAPPQWNLSRDRFVAALERSVSRRFSVASPSETAVQAYLESLQVSDLALACACSSGNAAAWDFFIEQFRPGLYRAARAIAGEANSGELADSLYADLYGLRESDGRRKSLLDYFHGRSQLSTWLRAVLAQRHIDEIRRKRKTESIDDEAGARQGEMSALEAPADSRSSSSPDPERDKYLAILQAALTSALASLDPCDRLRLAYYYADGRTLAEIGRLLREHEATVSRKLDRTRRDVRHKVEALLREEKRWDEAQVRTCLEYARGEWPFDLEKSLRPEISRFETVQADAESTPD